MSCRNKYRSLKHDEAIYYRGSNKGKALETGFQADSNTSSSSRSLNHNDER